MLSCLILLRLVAMHKTTSTPFIRFSSNSEISSTSDTKLNSSKKRLGSTFLSGLTSSSLKWSKFSLNSRKNVIYNGKIILLIEGIDKFREKDNSGESRLKFWLPKYFPTRFRVIVTASKASQSYAYLKKQGCQILKVEASTDVYKSLLRSYQKRLFVVSDAFKTRLFDVLQKKIDSESIADTLMIKAAIGCLCPYQTPQIVSISDETAAKINQVLLSFDLNEYHRMTQIIPCQLFKGSPRGYSLVL